LAGLEAPDQATPLPLGQEPALAPLAFGAPLPEGQVLAPGGEPNPTLLVNGVPTVAPSLELYCICRQPETAEMIGCDECEEWFHPHCFGIELVSQLSKAHL
jgi:hypothetical protein